jgi:hypothetical protein
MTIRIKTTLGVYGGSTDAASWGAHGTARRKPVPGGRLTFEGFARYSPGSGFAELAPNRGFVGGSHAMLVSRLTAIKAVLDNGI